MKKLYIPYIAGEFISSGKRLVIRSPYTGEPIFETFSADNITLNKAIEKAVAAKSIMAALPSWKKEELLLQIAQKIK